MKQQTIEWACQVMANFTDTASTKADLKKAYKRGALGCHPDRQVANDIDVSMADLNKAWDIINEHSDEFALATIQKYCETQAFVASWDQWKLDPLHTADVPSFKPFNTLLNDEFDIVDSLTDNDEWFNNRRWNGFYVRSPKVYVNTQHESVRVTTLDNAMQRGKEVVTYTLSFPHHRDGYFDAVQAFFNNRVGDWDVISFLSFMESLTFSVNRFGGFEALSMDGFDIYKSVSGSFNCFSPFEFHRLKPLTELPKKWTVLHLARVLANGQYAKYRQCYYYTDDYALDSACNYRKGYYDSPMSTIEEIIDSHKPFSRLYENRRREGNNVTLNFGSHSNDGRELEVVLDNRFPAVDLTKEQQILATLAAKHQYDIVLMSGDTHTIESQYTLEERDPLLDAIWDNTDADLKGITEDGDMVIYLDCALTESVPLDLLSDEQIKQRHPAVH